jgi:MFS family permease
VGAGLFALLFVRNRPGDYGQLPDGRTASDDLAHAGVAAPVHRTREVWTVRDAVRTASFWLISIAAVGESIPSTAAVAHAVPHLRDLGHSASAAAGALGLFAICTIVGKLSAGFIGDRVEPRYAWSACIMMMGLAVWVATRAQSAAVMYLFTGMLGFGSGAALTCWHATVANYFGPTLFASILGVQYPFNNAVAAASPFLVGLAYDTQHSYTMAFYAIAIISVIAAVPLLAAAPPRLKRAQLQSPG